MSLKYEPALEPWGKTPWLRWRSLWLRFPRCPRKVDVRLPGKGNSNSHGARPVHLIITMIKWVRKDAMAQMEKLMAQVLSLYYSQA